MKPVYRTGWLVAVLAAVASVSWGDRQPAQAQFPGASPSHTTFELDDTVQLDRPDSQVLAQLERVKAYLADRQWEEAIETLREVMEGSEGKLLGATDRRYISLRDYGHLQLAALPAEALKLYRGRVDPLAGRWYQDGVARRDHRLLAHLLEQAFNSSWGDDALMALGEMALESGDYTSARWCWERVVPARLPADAPRTWPGFPDSDLDLAAVRARLVLVSILEGSTARARDELTEFTRLHPDARGRLGGREVNYTEALRALLAESTAWPRPQPSPDWPTFAGATTRNKISSEMVDPGRVGWRSPLDKVVVSAPIFGPSDLAPRTVAEDAVAALSYHPVLVGGLVLVNDWLEIRALNVDTGRPAWGEDQAAIYREEWEGAISSLREPPGGALGAPRFTMTVFNGRLYARMGGGVTGWAQGGAEFASPSATRPGYLVCLDLAAEGRLMWKITAEVGWAFEGSPVADETSVYVGMRRNDIRPQASVACFDAQTGRRRWRRFVCGAETPARGMLHQCTHNLLTLAGDTLYYNTNLGAVAAISTDDGRIRWVSLYPRARRGDLFKLAPHWQRDLNPCLYDHGTLLVAPADSPRIFALDAATGQILWQTGPEVQDAVHLLGTTGDYLIAAGGKLYWIGLREEDKGRVKHVWPDGHEKPGYGRGVLAADCVLWPTREKIYVFDQKTARPKKVIDLVPRGATGGNLLVADGRLLIATGTELIALSRQGGAPEKNRPTVGWDGVPPFPKTVGWDEVPTFPKTVGWDEVPPFPKTVGWDAVPPSPIAAGTRGDVPPGEKAFSRRLH